MTDAPERIWLTPEDAAAFGRKYGHPGVTMVCVGDPSVCYVHEDHVDAIVAEKVREALTEAEDAVTGVTLNLSGWMDRRRENLTLYANHILHSVRAYEAEIAALRALAETTKGEE